jgi:hypothetical protein
MSDFMDKVRAKMQAGMSSFEQRSGVNLSGQPRKRRQQTRQIVKHTRFDELDWLDARKDQTISDGIQQMFIGEKGNGTDEEWEQPPYLNAPELVQDVFYTFIKPVPTLHKKKDVKKDARLNGKFLEQMMALPEYERLHDQTMTDPMLSTMASGIVMDALKEMIKQHREAVKDANERRKNGDLDEAPDGEPGGNNDSWDEETPSTTKSNKNQGKSKVNEGEDQEQGDGADEDDWKQDAGDQDDDLIDPWADEEQDDEEDDDSESDLLDDLERAWDEALLEDEEWEDEADLDKMLSSQDFARSINNALSKAADEIGELDDLRRGVGIEDAEWKQMDPSARLKMAERLNTPRMKQIADMVGRMKRFAMAQQATKIIDAPHEIFDVEMGNDLRRVIRSEFAFLGREETKIEFFYEATPTVSCSSSRSADVRLPARVRSSVRSTTPARWAARPRSGRRAWPRRCGGSAQDQDRDFHAIYFETNRHRERFDFPKGKSDFEKVLKFLSVSAGGGTEFDGVLTEALGKCATMFDEKQGQGRHRVHH